MSKLVDAVSPSARLILLGDQDQLASVEAGAILGDICNAQGTRPSWSKDLSETMSALGLKLPEEQASPKGLQDSIVQLTHSFRFGSSSGIGRLAQAINAGDSEQALRVLREERFDDVIWEDRKSVV